MQSNPVNAGSTVTVGATNRTPSPELDKDAFMKLMIAQLQHQDPTAPQDSTAMMAQVSQMTMVEQITNLASTAAAQAKDAKLARSEALIGRTVTYLDKDKNPISGVVEKVATSGDKPALTINGVDGIDPATLTEVR